MEATDVLQVGGNGLVGTEGEDTRIWDFMCILNTIGDPTSDLPGAVDIKSLQAPFFTAEARRRPFLAVLYLNVVTRAGSAMWITPSAKYVFCRNRAYL
jgi:hypothetical protein